MIDLNSPNDDINRMVNLGIIERVGGNIRYTKKALDLKMKLVDDPKIRKMFEESTSEWGITNEKDLIIALFAIISSTVLVEFVGGMINQKEFDVYIKYMTAMDRMYIDDVYET